MKYTIKQIHQILHLSSSKKYQDGVITQFLTDSRRLFHPQETLFIALKTNHQDGHQYISELYEKGVRAFLVHQNFDTRSFPKATFFPVKNPLSAFQEIATSWRTQFHIPVIGITGSNGKTIVKEWLFQLLQPDFRLIRSPKSFNSQTGVPLSVTEINSSHQMALFEAGISQVGEMEKLKEIIQPTMGIFTNIGEAHAEGFKNKREKIREKLKLFPEVKLLIYHADNPILTEEILQFQKEGMELFSWCTSKESHATLLITQIKKQIQENGRLTTSIQGIYQQEKIAIKIPFTDNGSIENAIHCWCLLLHLKVAENTIAERMWQLQTVAMRLEMKPGINDCILINDSYNSDYTSIKVALDFLQHQKQKKKHTFILSDVEQSNAKETELYQKISDLIRVKDIQRFIGIGEALNRQKHFFAAIPQTSFYLSTTSFLKDMKEKYKTDNLFQKETILLKGARSFNFEKIYNYLAPKKHQATLTIDLNAVAHNLKTYQALLQPKVKTMVMVKAFSYGSGSAEIAGLLQYHGVDYLAVANIDEGIHLRKNGITLPILILNPDAFYFDELIQWKLEPEIYSFSILKEFHKKISSQGIPSYPIHIKLDTGMHRLGFMEKDISSLISYLKTHSSLKTISIFSHLAASENPEMDSFTKEQGKRFDKMSKQLLEVLPQTALRHLSNSSGISRHPSLQYDMVRLGIGLYGIDSILQDQLQPVHKLRATISQIKEIKAGETIGYGRAAKVDSQKRIAIVSLGYADGYLRSLGLGKGKMFLHQRWAPTIGQICMDMLMLDISDIPEAREGDEVTVFGTHPRIEDLATEGNTIPYEILSGLSQRIIRVYTQE